MTIFPGEEPPKFAPNTGPPDIPTVVCVNGVWLETEKSDDDGEIPF